MVRLWWRTRGAMGELGHLPESGGVIDQHGPTMEALDYLSGVFGWLDRRFPREPRSRKAG